MKDSTMILVIAVMVMATALYAAATRQIEETIDAIERVRAAQMSSAMRAMTSTNKTVRLHVDGRNFMKGRFSL